MKLIIENLDELKALGEKIGKSLKGGELIGLKGNLGVGKTTLTKYIAKSIGVKEEVVSPTFNIVKVYESNKGMLYHIDAYRLEELKYDPILDDYLFDDSAIKVVEWYNFIEENLYDFKIVIDIKLLPDSKREINIMGDLCID